MTYNNKHGKPSKPLTFKSLEKSGLRYLGRYATTQAKFLKILENKIRHANENNADPNEEQKNWAITIADKCVSLGYIDDTAYAASRARVMVRRGKPMQMIISDLRHKGIESDIIKDVIADLAPVDVQDGERLSPDARAAASYIKRRRFGCFRRIKEEPVNEGQEQKHPHNKEIQSLMRAGFNPDLARKILEMDEDEVLLLID